MAIEYVCERCGSTNVTSDTVSQWSKARQRWITVGHYDSSECHDCEDEADLIPREIAEAV